MTKPPDDGADRVEDKDPDRGKADSLAEDWADGLSYEEARDQLMGVVQQLESGGATLQESVALWERGERLADICQRWLDGARARLDAATSD